MARPLLSVAQEGFRWRNDDGSETAATWKAAQDTNTTLALDTPVRLRVLLDASADPDPQPYTLYYKKVGDATWLPVPVGAGAASGPLLEDDWTGTNSDPWNTTKWPTLSGGTITIQSNAGQIIGGRAIAYSEVTATDFELLVKRTGDSGGYPEIGYRVFTLGGSPQGYVLQFAGAGSGPMGLYLMSGYSTVATGSVTGFTGVTTTWFRIRVVGTNHKVRWWLDGGAEPGTWQIDATDSTFLGGRFMLGNWSGTHSYDDLTVTDLAPITGSVAARRANSGRYYVSAGSLAASDFTTCGWFKLQATASGTNSTMIGADAGSSSYWVVFVASGVLQIDTNGGTLNTGYAPTVDTWYFVADSYVESTGIHTLRIAPDGGSMSTFTSVALDGIEGGENLFVGGNGFTAWFEGSIAAVKVWDAALSGTELADERTSYAAVRTADLWAEYRFDSEPFTTDTSGNGRTLTSDLAVPHRVEGPPELPSVGGGGPVYIATSSNVTAGGQVTTAQLTAPFGKTTGDFSVGRMWDDENGTDSVDI